MCVYRNCHNTTFQLNDGLLNYALTRWEWTKWRTQPPVCTLAEIKTLTTIMRGSLACSLRRTLFGSWWKLLERFPFKDVLEPVCGVVVPP